MNGSVASNVTEMQAPVATVAAAERDQAARDLGHSQAADKRKRLSAYPHIALTS